MSFFIFDENNCVVVFFSLLSIIIACASDILSEIVYLNDYPQLYTFTAIACVFELEFYFA